MRVSLTVFKNIFDNKTNQSVDYASFDEFEQTLYNLANNDTFKTKKSAFLISPASYKPDTTRANDNVLSWSFGIVDVDDYEGKIEDIQEKYSGYKYVCYSTASSTKELPKFRLVFPLTSVVNKKDISHFWFALNKEIGEIGDAQTKDMSRMFYIPSQYDGAYNFIFTHEGEIMNPSEIMQKHKYIAPSNDNFLDKLPKSIRDGLMAHKMKKLTNTSYSWNGYNDCPFVYKKQIDEYKTISGTGWYYKLYAIMVTIAGNAIKKGYPITANEIEYIIREIDAETGGWYAKRPIRKEAQRAIDYIFKGDIL